MLKIQKDSLDSKIMKFMEMEEEFQELKEKVRYEEENLWTMIERIMK